MIPHQLAVFLRFCIAFTAAARRGREAFALADVSSFFAAGFEGSSFLWMVEDDLFAGVGSVTRRFLVLKVCFARGFVVGFTCVGTKSGTAGFPAADFLQRSEGSRPVVLGFVWTADSCVDAAVALFPRFRDIADRSPCDGVAWDPDFNASTSDGLDVMSGDLVELKRRIIFGGYSTGAMKYQRGGRSACSTMAALRAAALRYSS